MAQFVTDTADAGIGIQATSLPSLIVLSRPCPFNPAAELHNEGPAAVSFVPAQYVSGVIGQSGATVLEPGETVLVEEGLGSAFVGTVQAHGERAMFSFRRGRMVDDVSVSGGV